MFEDFLNLSYWKTANKRWKIRDIINRLDIPSIDLTLKNIQSSLNQLQLSINQLPIAIDDSKEEPLPPEDLPDLIIESIVPTDMGHYWDFAITVKNIGDAEAGASILNAVIPEVSNVNLSIPALGINETATVHTQVSYDPDSTEEQNRTMLATVDSTNIVNEKLNQNNTKQCQVMLKRTYVPPVGTLTYLICHAHNPEGLEINSVLYPTFDISTYGAMFLVQEIGSPTEDFIGFGAKNSSEHGTIIGTVIDPGEYDVICRFNGIDIKQRVIFDGGNTKELTFILPRTEAEIDFASSDSKNFNHSVIFQGNPNSDIQIAGDTAWLFYSQCGGSGGSIIPGQEAYASATNILAFNFNKNYSNFSFDLTLTAGGYNLASAYSSGIINIFDNVLFINLASHILPNTNFQNWYSQAVAEKYYPSIRIYDMDESNINIIQAEQSVIKQLDATKEFYKVRAIPNIFGDASPGQSIIYPNSSSNINYLAIATLKISSIPYDIDNIGV